MLLVFRPISVGQWVEVAGQAGTVVKIDVFTTALNTGDNVRIVVPNGKIFNEIIKNYHANDTRRIDLVIGVDYGDDLTDAIRVITDTIQADERVLEEPAPVVQVHELGDSSVNLVVRPWVRTEDYWLTRWELTKTIKEQVEAAGLSIPFPQRDVHLFQEAS
ncbi:MAG: mechanosensitive ion channel family protein [Halobacteriales archaeon]|nr:mechanosensitive ion channel family protein [Halobacteriales archaeon]